MSFMTAAMQRQTTNEWKSIFIVFRRMLGVYPAKVTSFIFN